MKLSVFCVLIAIAKLGFIGAAMAGVPNAISYQGRLTTPAGTPVPDGFYQIKFVIYNAPTGGTEIWNSGLQSVSVAGGLFSVELGAPPMPVLLPQLWYDSSRYVGTSVGIDPEMTPRARIVSSAFAFLSAKSDTAKLARSVRIGDSTMIADSVGIRIGDATQPSEYNLMHLQRTWNSSLPRRGEYISAYNAGSGGINGLQVDAGTASGQPNDVSGIIANVSGDGPNRTAIYGVAQSAGSSTGATFGVMGSATLGNDVYGVFGAATSGTNCYGLYGYALKQSNSYAGYFDGHVNITGTLSKAAGAFRIDHPLDPQNKYLQHSFVESPDMMNIYNGNVTTDAEGLATVTLPDYFESLNQDFRYQLTVIGKFAQAIVAGEVSNNHFSIQTNQPNVKVSWQVTGIRKDAFANTNRIQVEVDKVGSDRGKYLNPEAFGLPRERGIRYKETSDAIHH